MVTLEMRTVLLNYAISNAICLGIVFSLWRKHRHCSPAFDFWLGSFTLQFFSMLMFSLRGVVPEPIAILLGVPRRKQPTGTGWWLELFQNDEME